MPRMVNWIGVELERLPSRPTILTTDVPVAAVSLAENVTTVDVGEVDGAKLAVTPEGSAPVVKITLFVKPPVVETLTAVEPLVR